MGKTEGGLQAVDYVVFSVMLLVSASIGLLYAFTGGRQKTAKEYLMANRKMSVFPVALSLLASFMSAITLLGTPSEMYQYGTQYWLIGPSYFFVCFLAAHVLLPVFYPLQLTSAHEYLERRFNKVVRIQGCATFLVQMTMYMGIVLYAPALALNAVTGLSWIVSVLILGIVCTFYTTIGGMKAVMWTDVFQVTIMFIGMLVIVIKGSQDIGGMGKVFSIVEKTERLNLLDFDPNPLVRHTVWCLVLGGACTWLVIYGVNQSQVQRYLTTPTLRQAQIAIWINLPGLWGLLTICALAGLVAFAHFHEEGCDPLSAKYIQKGDQILPYYVMTAFNYPGFPGLFIATIFSGALSTVSSGLNALAAVTLEDIVKPYLAGCLKIGEVTEKRGAVISKVLAFSYGILAVALAFVASAMGDVLQAALGLFGMVGGPLLGIFLLGILFPCANWKGACVGHLVGEVMSLWVGFGGYIYKYPVYKPPMETCNCPPMNVTVQNFEAKAEAYSGLGIYRLSYMWQGAWALIWTMAIGLIVSLLTGGTDRKRLDPRLICPIFDKLCCYLPESIRSRLRCGVEHGREAEDKEPESGERRTVAALPGKDLHPRSAPYNNPSFLPERSQRVTPF